MKFYFELQYRLLNRQLAESGMPPLFAGLLVAISFVVISQYLILKAPYSSWMYAMFPVVFAFAFNGTERNVFLKSCFSDKLYYQIRMVENIILALPFSLMLAVNGKFLIAFVALIISYLLTFIKVSTKNAFTLPTPFYKFPFEFLVGFRKAFLWVLLVYIICGIAIAVQNFNLGVVALIVIHLTCASFYFQPENHFFVWCYSMTSTEFLFNKIKILLLYTTFLTLPILIAMAVAFYDQYMVLSIVQMIGCLTVIASLLSKYVYFPRSLPIPDAILFLLGVIFVPSVLVFIPYFYVKSRGNLKAILK